MSECDTVYFCKGWENARGCKIEHEVAKSYGYKYHIRKVEFHKDSLQQLFYIINDGKK